MENYCEFNVQAEIEVGGEFCVWQSQIDISFQNLDKFQNISNGWEN